MRIPKKKRGIVPDGHCLEGEALAVLGVVMLGMVEVPGTRRLQGGTKLKMFPNV